jgi:hypothetical protein
MVCRPASRAPTLHPIPILVDFLGLVPRCTGELCHVQNPPTPRPFVRLVRGVKVRSGFWTRCAPLQELPAPIVPWCSDEFSELQRSTRVFQASAEATQKGTINSRIDGDCFFAHGLGHSVVALVALGPVPPDAGLSSVWVICTVQHAALLLRGSWHVAPRRSSRHDVAGRRGRARARHTRCTPKR